MYEFDLGLQQWNRTNNYTISTGFETYRGNITTQSLTLNFWGNTTDWLLVIVDSISRYNDTYSSETLVFTTNTWLYFEFIFVAKGYIWS